MKLSVMHSVRMRKTGIFKKMIDNYIGKSFPGNIVFMGYAFLVGGAVMMVLSPLFGIILLLLGAFASFSYSRIQIDPKQNKFREFTSILGTTGGKWIDLQNYPFLTTLVKNESYSSFSKTAISISAKDTFYDVCLMTRDHRKQVLVKRLNNKEAAMEYARLLSEQLNKPLMKYDPPVSTQTKKRK